MNKLEKCAKLKKIQAQSRRKHRRSLTRKNHKNDTTHVGSEIHCSSNKNAKHVWPGGRQTDSRVTCQTKQTRTRKMQAGGEGQEKGTGPITFNM